MQIANTPLAGAAAPFRERRLASSRNHVTVNGRKVPLPRWRIARVVLGVVLILGGVLGFLPVVGFWMIPLGLVVLSVDWAPARRLRRRLAVWFERRWGSKNGNRQPRR